MIISFSAQQALLIPRVAGIFSLLLSNVTHGQRVGWLLHPAVGVGSDKLSYLLGYKVILT